MKVLIFGASGQDGTLLSQLLERKGYEVFKASRNNKSDHTCDITDTTSVRNLVDSIKPDIIYDLAAFTSVGGSYKRPAYTIRNNTVGLSNILDVLRDFQDIKLVHASSSEIFGPLDFGDKYTENSDLNPTSPYGVSKASAYQLCQIYRKSYNLNISCAILFNHTSRYQSHSFLIPKVVQYVKQKYDGTNRLTLGDLGGYRDFVSARDVVRALDLMAGKNDNYLVCTGNTYQIEHVVARIFNLAGYSNYKYYIDYSDQYVRPNANNYSCGNPSKIEKECSWTPQYSLDDIIKDMLYG